MPQLHQSPLNSTDQSHIEPSQCSGEGDADSAEDADGGGDGNGVEDTDGSTGGNAEGKPNSKPLHLGQGLVGKRHLSPSKSLLR